MNPGASIISLNARHRSAAAPSTRAARPQPPSGRRRQGPEGKREAGGFVLVAVLTVVLLASMMAVSLLFRLKAEATAEATSAGAEQAWAAAMTGIEEAIRRVTDVPPGATDWQDDPRQFREQFVFDDGSDRWYFTVCSPAMDDALQELRFGLTDEAGKLNLNAAHTTNLLHLPRLTPALTDALRDFVDRDTASRQEASEQSFTDALGRQRSVRNGPLNTVEELLLVRGFTPALLYGEDANMNWRLDPNEQDGNERFPPDDADSRLELGLRQYVTVASYDPNEDDDGVPRTRLQSRERLPAVELPAALTNFIAVLRTNRFPMAHPAELLEATLKVKDAKGRPVEVSSGVSKAELPLVLDLFTCTTDARFDGLINVNTASLRVLQTVPGIDEPLAEAILSTRRSISPEHRRSLAWLYQEGLVDAAHFKQIAPFLTARSFQYSFHVIGYGLPSGRYRVLDVLIDLASGKPRITYLRELTRLGLPFRLEAKEAPDA
jgi:type II secretion system (T2SS) protein K